MRWARSRVGRVFSRRLAPLISSQTRRAGPPPRPPVTGSRREEGMGPLAGGEDVLPQVRPVDLLPDPAGEGGGLRLGEVRKLAEVRFGVAERRLAGPPETLRA